MQREELDKLLSSMSIEEIEELARTNKARYMMEYHARKELERRIADAEREEDATV